MAAGSIVVELLLKTGSFETDTQRSAKALKQFQKEAEAVGRAIGLSLVGIAIAAGTAAIAMGKAALESIDAFNDLKDATGASIENISAIDRVARETGVGFETVSTALIKLNQALNSAKPDSPTAEALARIGLSFKELRALDPAEALRQVAVALSKFADDGNKARLVQELFGKSLKDVAPLLNDLATKTELVGTVSTEAALEVEKFRKEIFRLEANSTDLARSLTIDLVSALNQTIEKFRQGAREGESFFQTLRREQLKILGFNVRLPSEENYSNEGRGSIDRNENYGNEGRVRRSVGDPEEKDKKRRATAKKAREEFDEHVKAYIDYLKILDRAAIEAAQAQESLYLSQLQVAEGLRAEAEAAREQAAIYGLTRDELHEFNREKMLAAAVSLETLAAQKEEKEGNEEIARLYRQQATAIRETAAARDALNQKQRDAQYNPLTGAENAVKDYLAQIAKAGDESYRLVDDTLRGLEDALTSALASGNVKKVAKSFVDQIISEVYRLYVVKPILDSIFGNSGGLSSILGLFSSGLNVDTSGVGTNLTGGGLPTRGGAATGTNFVERDMVTILHKGEAVVPKAYNPAAGGGASDKIEVHNYSGATVREETQQTGDRKIRRLIIGEVVRDSRRGGPTRQATREAVGPRPRRG